MDSERWPKIAGRIKAVRKKQGLSQAEFAEKLRITRGHVSKLEIGQAMPSEQLLTLISELFMIKWQWLTKGEGDMHLSPGDLKELEKSIQKIHYGSLKDSIEVFLLYHDLMKSRLLEKLKATQHFSGAYCPPEVMDGLREILKRTNEDLFQLVRERLKAWGQSD